MRKFIFFIIYLAVLSANCQAAEVIHIATGDWEPYLSRHMSHFGPLNQVITEAFAMEGITVEYGFFPWKRALLVSKSGEWDGSSVWGYHEERLKYFYYSEPVAEQRYYFFHLKDFDFDWNTYQDLEKVGLIGASMGYNYHDAFQNAEKEGKIKVRRVGSEKQILQMLLFKRIQLALLEMVVAKETMRKTLSSEEAARITYAPKVQSVDTLHLILSKKVKANAERLIKFNRGLKQLRETGKIKKYIQDALDGKYSTKDLPGRTE